MNRAIGNRAKAASRKLKLKKSRSKGTSQESAGRSSPRSAQRTAKLRVASVAKRNPARSGTLPRRIQRQPAVVRTTKFVPLPSLASSVVQPPARPSIAHAVEMEDWVEAVRQAHILHDTTVPKVITPDESLAISSEESAGKFVAPQTDTIIAGTASSLVVANQVAQAPVATLSSTSTVSHPDNRKAAEKGHTSKSAVLPTFGAESSWNRVERIIMLLLGMFWIIDGLLQFQPGSFTQTFVNSVLVPNLQGQPAGILDVLSPGVGLYGSRVFAANFVAAVTQILIGAMLVFRFKRPFKIFALYFSIVWSLMVWIIGEGLGNVLTGGTSFYTGAPGSVLLYLILAVFLLFPKRLTVAKLPVVAGALFLLGAFLQISPTFWSTNGVQSVFQLASSDSLGFIAAPAKSVASFASSLPAFSNLLLVLVLVVFGGFLLFGPSRAVACSATVFLGLVWWFGQDFGGVQTFPMSTATDPNSAPIFMLFLIPAFAGLRAGFPRNIVELGMKPASSFGNLGPVGGRRAVGRRNRMTPKTKHS